MSDKRFNNELQGALFKKIKDKETSPDYGGECEINGVQYWISAWINQSRTQQKFMSLRFKAKEQKAPGAKPPETADFDDEIPF